MRIRAAREGDIAWLAETSAAIYADVFAATIPGFDPKPFGAAHFSGRFAQSWPRVRIGQEGERRLGFALVTEGTLDMLFVAGGARDGGSGLALLRDAEAHGATTLECFAENAAARRFYERAGWRLAESYERLFGGRPHAFVRYETGPAQA